MANRRKNNPDTHYNGLYDLIETNGEANELYASLPDYVQDAICQRADSVCTTDELRSYADNLLRGDG